MSQDDRDRLFARLDSIGDAQTEVKARTARLSGQWEQFREDEWPPLRGRMEEIAVRLQVLEKEAAVMKVRLAMLGGAAGGVSLLWQVIEKIAGG